MYYILFQCNVINLLTSASFFNNLKGHNLIQVGDDTFGENYLKSLDDDGINKEYVTTVGNVSTGVATIVVDGKGYIF